MKRLQSYYQHHDPSLNLIIQTSIRLLVPFVQLFGLYVIAHGHYSPGGGFQGGVILGASFILLGVGFDLRYSLKLFPEALNAILANLGVTIFVGMGLICAFAGGLFMDYGALSNWIGIDPAAWRSLGILIIEAGVGLTVTSAMVSLFWDLSSRGEHSGGL